MDTFRTEMIKINDWSTESTEKFNKWLSDQKMITFAVSAMASGRNFGRLLLHSDENNDIFYVAYGLCVSHLAIDDKKFMNGKLTNDYI